MQKKKGGGISFVQESQQWKSKDYQQSFSPFFKIPGVPFNFFTSFLDSTIHLVILVYSFPDQLSQKL